MTPAEAARAVLVDDFEGTLAIGDVREDAESYAVEFGHKKGIVGGDDGCMLLGSPIAVVDKVSWAVSIEPYAGNEARFDVMTRCR